MLPGGQEKVEDVVHVDRSPATHEYLYGHAGRRMLLQMVPAVDACCQTSTSLRYGSPPMSMLARSMFLSRGKHNSPSASRRAYESTAPDRAESYRDII